MKKTIAELQQKKFENQPITMLTAYDYPTAFLEDQAGVDVVLLGDSVGTNVLGYENENEVTLADMLHHLRAVVRGVKNAFVISDMPFGTADDPFKAYENACLLIEQGADCVKVEGWKEKKNVIANLADKGICVCAHIGYNPQIHGGVAKVFGKEAVQATELVQSAQILEKAGASMIVVEKVPQEITEIITGSLRIPVIGIGSGALCDGQVLVVNDILGLTPKVFRHAHRYVDLRTLVTDAVRGYCHDVVTKKFPSEENVWHCDQNELQKVISAVKSIEKQ